MDLNDKFLNKAKTIVANYYNGQHSYAEITNNDVFIVWFCKTLQNWKALITTIVPDGVYYEVTYNGDKHEAYLDIYQKLGNICVSDFEW